MKFRFLLCPIVFLLACSESENENFPLQYVNPFVGTGGHGHTFPGATVPFGMVQLSPDTRLTGWDGCSGYHYSDSVIFGFSHTHLQGTGVSDYGDILLMPGTGKIHLDNGVKNGYENGYASRFDKSSESASPGFYAVHLDKPNTNVELTTTVRTGIHHYIQHDDVPLHLVVDLKHRDKVKEASMRIVSKTEVEGYRISEAWARDQRVYFVMQFSEPITDFIEPDFESAELGEDSVFNFPGKVCGLKFDTSDLLVKVGISATSTDGARRNLAEEAPHWDFAKYRKQAENFWINELRKIEVKDEDEEKLTNFYTALYHSFVAPNIFTDVDGKYRGTDGEIHQAESHDQYTVFSLWDTFRATHPLYTILQRERTEDFIHTFLKMYEQGGQLPVWELAGNYTGCMIGYHSVPVIVDAYFKGITDFDTELALEAMIQAADSAHLGKAEFANHGFIPADAEHESVSKTLEYAYDDWCIAQFAKALGKDSIYDRFIVRAQAYKNIFDPKTGFMRARKNGSYITPFDPAEVNFHFTEANSYQYSYFVPQDVSGLIQLNGGHTKFSNRLDALFAADTKLSGRGQPDITGLIGQYAHGNEPSHHMAYLYNYAGHASKTQEMVNRILNEMYSNSPDGLAGNEDCGQMSSWYVLSAMGFYPVTPGTDQYTFGSPQFDEVILNMENGKQFIIKTKRKDKNAIYIKSIKLDGKDHPVNSISNEVIMNGGELVFEMRSKPNTEFGRSVNERPVSSITDNLISPVPVMESIPSTFTDSLEIDLYCSDPEARLYYEMRVGNRFIYREMEDSTFLYDNAEIDIWSEREGYLTMPKVTTKFRKVDPKRTVKLLTEYDSQYTAEGPLGLIDGVYGGKEFRTGGWQGYQGKNMEAVIDLSEIQKVNRVSATFLQDISPWIWLPRSVEILISEDGENFERVAVLHHNISPKDEQVQIKKIETKVNRDARYVKVVAENIGTIPDWHLGAGNQAWLFVDEIIIE